MCRHEAGDGCGCHGRSEYGHYGPHMRCGFPMMSIEEEVETLGEIKATLEKRLEDINKRLELLKR